MLNSSNFALFALSQGATVVVWAVVAMMVVGMGVIAVRCLRKVEQGRALVRNGLGGARVNFSSMFVFPVLHRLEIMDISVKRVEIYRHGPEGLVETRSLDPVAKAAISGVPIER